jgi:hypothetical protein
MEEVKLSEEQLRAIALAKSAQEVAEICQSTWRPNIAEQIALQEGVKVSPKPVKAFPFKSGPDGLLIPDNDYV